MYKYEIKETTKLPTHALTAQREFNTTLFLLLRTQNVASKERMRTKKKEKSQNSLFAS